MGGKPGDLLLFAADKDKVVFDVLGNLRLEIARQLDLLKKDDFKFLWVTEFPLLEYSEEAGSLRSYAPSIYHADGRGSVTLIDTDPGTGTCKGIRYRIKRYRDGRRFCPYPPGRHPVEDV